MSKKLEYFAEFLGDPSKYEFNEFYRMVEDWIQYIKEHKEEFNYLEDDEWKEIRERLLTELNKRETHRREVEEDWKDICSTLEHIEMFNDKDAIRVMTRQLDFMKDYQVYFNITDEQIAELDEYLTVFVKSVKESEEADLAAAQSRKKLDESAAKLDDALVKHYERTGKIPAIPVYGAKKKHNGN